MTSSAIPGKATQNGSLAWRMAIAAALAIAILAIARSPFSPAPMPRPAITNAAVSAPRPLPPDARPQPALSAEDARTSNDRVPIADPSPLAARPFTFAGDDESRLRARDCLAVAAFHEAGDDPAGERAVVQVVLNRVRHPAFPDSVCAVVFQGSERKTGCQFTFTCDGALGRVSPPAALVRARAIAQAALTGAVEPHVGLATHYHADYVVPRWRDGMVKLARQGVHLFYRWPGYWGSPAAMRRTPPATIEPRISAMAAASGSPAPAAERPADIGLLPALARPLPLAIPAALDFVLDPQAATGTFALKALSLCGRSADCRVAGRIAQDVGFLYVRRGGSEGAYWDCARFQRADQAQCLPKGPALQRLLAAS
ncbi:cell wall hydrolase SleB [Sphingomonas sp. LH128]|uniref:Cell wall hydrolase SleB n=1 Tax=Novosphingobium resinovorum TaxID=158500 RepID=A0A031JXR5_9SPHN|nr:MULTISPECIES: cell wall hydrolase [Sphingomonadaceae]EJU12655.1 cell wall hydrolase SleB [Sphingomonas sp. LH128]EZP81725.1 Cell wall hydrolase SleB [Novosphingobium resinovorum]